MPSRVLTLSRPLELRATLGTLAMKAQGRLRATDRSAQLAVSTPDGPAAASLDVAGTSLRADAYGPGAGFVLDALPRLLGEDDDPASFQPPRGLVRDLHSAHPGLRLGSTGRVFDALVPTILGQKVTSKEAGASYRRLVERFGEPAPGPFELMLPPAPEVMAGLPDWDFHTAGVERKRAGILREAARRANRLEEITTMARDDAYTRLEAIRGIGRWTSAQVMGIAWGDRDAVATGDYHLPNLVTFALAGEPRGNDDRMIELLEPYAGHRRRALVLLKRSGVAAPKYGPRSEVRSIASI